MKASPSPDVIIAEALKTDGRDGNLILHQGDKGRNNQGNAWVGVAVQQGRQLVDQRLPRSSCQENQGGLASQDPHHSIQLARSEVRISPPRKSFAHLVLRGMERWHGVSRGGGFLFCTFELPASLQEVSIIGCFEVKARCTQQGRISINTGLTLVGLQVNLLLLRSVCRMVLSLRAITRWRQFILPVVLLLDARQKELACVAP